MAISEGKKAPEFSLPASTGGTVSLKDFRGRQPVLLYFYPKDDTPGCTTEACEFRDAWDEFGKSGGVVLGVSPDPVASHEKFRDKYELPFPLLSDEDHEVLEKYGAWGEKKMYGKTFEGVLRSSVLIDRDGKIARHWPKVKPKGHAAEALEALRSL